MKYFKPVSTEEEAKDEYRKLLIKYDYKNPQNEMVINEITKEYNSIVSDIRYNNGERSFFQKYVYDSRMAEKINEKNRYLDQIRKQAYSKSDVSEIVVQIKKILADRSDEFLFAKDSTILDKERCNYMTLMAIDRSRKLPKRFIYYSYVNHSNSMKIFEGDDRIRILRIKLEYCVYYIYNQKRTEAEECLGKLEDLLGSELIELVYRKIPNLDPIIDLKINKEIETQEVAISAVRNMECREHTRAIDERNRALFHGARLLSRLIR